MPGEPRAMARLPGVPHPVPFPPRRTPHLRPRPGHPDKQWVHPAHLGLSLPRAEQLPKPRAPGLREGTPSGTQPPPVASTCPPHWQPSPPFADPPPRARGPHAVRIPRGGCRGPLLGPVGPGPRDPLPEGPRDGSLTPAQTWGLQRGGGILSGSEGVEAASGGEASGQSAGPTARPLAHARRSPASGPRGAATRRGPRRQGPGWLQQAGYRAAGQRRAEHLQPPSQKLQDGLPAPPTPSPLATHGGSTLAASHQPPAGSRLAPGPWPTGSPPSPPVASTAGQQTLPRSPGAPTALGTGPRPAATAIGSHTFQGLTLTAGSLVGSSGPRPLGDIRSQKQSQASNQKHRFSGGPSSDE